MFPTFEEDSDNNNNNNLWQGSLNYLILEDQTMQMYGDFEGFPIERDCLGWCRKMTPEIGCHG